MWHLESGEAEQALAVLTPLYSEAPNDPAADAGDDIPVGMCPERSRLMLESAMATDCVALVLKQDVENQKRWHVFATSKTDAAWYKGWRAAQIN